jgi:hypothetical protein
VAGGGGAAAVAEPQHPAAPGEGNGQAIGDSDHRFDPGLEEAGDAVPVEQEASA